MTQNIITPDSLTQTANGKRFYLNSGIISVANTETTIVNIGNIGERDIRICVNPIFQFGGSGDQMNMYIKINNIIVFQTQYKANTAETQYGMVYFIIPANNSLEISFVNSDATSHEIGVSCYGKYLSLE